MTDDHVITAAAVLDLARSATAEDITAVIMVTDPEKLEAKLTELKQAPLAFMSELDEDFRIRFVTHARDRFMRKSA